MHSIYIICYNWFWNCRVKSWYLVSGISRSEM